MLTGNVDALRRTLVPITIRGPFGFRSVNAIVDTGFNGHLAVPDAVATQLGLVREGSILNRLADGRVSRAPTYAAEVEWVNGPVGCYCVGTALSDTLVGTALLEGCALAIDFGPAKTVEIR